MGLIVQKFGGSSVANVEKLEMVSNHIIQEVENRQSSSSCRICTRKNNRPINCGRSRNNEKSYKIA